MELCARLCVLSLCAFDSEPYYSVAFYFATSSFFLSFGTRLRRHSDPSEYGSAVVLYVWVRTVAAAAAALSLNVQSVSWADVLCEWEYALNVQII